MPQLKIEVSAAEILALRTIITNLVVIEADRIERLGGGRAADWIQDLNETCAGVVRQSDIHGCAPLSPSEYKAAAIDCLNSILGGIVIGDDLNKLNQSNPTGPSSN